MIQVLEDLKKIKTFLMLNLQLKFNQHDTVLIKTIEFKSVGKYCNAINQRNIF